MKASQWLGLVAAAFLIIGLAFGLAPVHAEGVSCGNGFHASSSLFTPPACADARSSRVPLVWGAMGVAVLLGIAALAMAGSERAAETRNRQREWTERHDRRRAS